MRQAPCVLIVEVDILVRHALAEYLRECGFRVLQAFNTDEARTLLARGRFAIDVALVDANAPGRENAFALVTWIRGNYPAIQVILAGTVEAAAQKAGDICDEGPTVPKPYDHQLVLDRIRRLLATRDRG
jgi:DNA-binding response OmpR family regulator